MADFKLTINKTDGTSETYPFNEEGIAKINLSTEKATNYTREYAAKLLERLKGPRNMPWHNKSNHFIIIDKSCNHYLGHQALPDAWEDLIELNDPHPRLHSIGKIMYEALSECVNETGEKIIFPKIRNDADTVYGDIEVINERAFDLNLRAIYNSEFDEVEVRYGAEYFDFSDDMLGNFKDYFKVALRSRVYGSSEIMEYHYFILQQAATNILNKYARDMGIPIYGGKKSFQEIVSLLSRHAECRPMGPHYWKAKRRFRGETITQKFKRLTVAKRKIDEVENVEEKEDVKKAKTMTINGTVTIQ